LRDIGRKLLYGAIGAGVWLAAALFVRFVPQAFDGGAYTVLLMAATVPAAWLLIQALVRLTRTPPSGRFLAVFYVTVTVVLLDVLALTLAPSFYGDETVRLYAMVWLVWGALAALAIAWWTAPGGPKA
jgi:hypothetical protein